MSLIGTVSSPMNARYSPGDIPDPAAPSVPETSPFMGNSTDAQHVVRVEVTDRGGPGVLQLRACGGEAEDGRGLGLGWWRGWPGGGGGGDAAGGR